MIAALDSISALSLRLPLLLLLFFLVLLLLLLLFLLFLYGRRTMVDHAGDDDNDGRTTDDGGGGFGRFFSLDLSLSLSFIRCFVFICNVVLVAGFL